MVQWVVGSIVHGGNRAISHSNQCSMTGVTKAVICVIPSVRNDAYKITLAANQKE